MKKNIIDSGMIDVYDIEQDLNLGLTLNTDECVVRFWQFKGVLLGKLDTLLPKFEIACAYLDQKNINYQVRKQGGLAVVSDDGILNISFIFKADKSIDLHLPYRWVSAYMVKVLKVFGLDVDVKEIKNSYCPGAYDLSVDDQKIAGIAQFKNREVIVVSVTLMVNGHQNMRSQLIKDFYKMGQSEHAKKDIYPNIELTALTSLQACAKEKITIVDVKKVIMSAEMEQMLRL